MNIKDLNPSMIENFIVSQLEYSKNMIERNNSYFSRESSLAEYRTIIAGGIRHSGSTMACARLFDPSKDVYISYSYQQVMSFNNLLLQSGITRTKKINFLYSTVAREKAEVLSDTLISKIAAKLSTYQDDYGCVPMGNCKNIIKNELRVYMYVYPYSLRGRLIHKNAIYWFDIGNGLCMSYMTQIKNFISISDAVTNDGTQQYVIL